MDLDIWPTLPIFISQYSPEMAGIHNIISALKHTDRVCGINLHQVSKLVSQRIVEAMRQPYPALKYLHLTSSSTHLMPSNISLPDSLLGGSAPYLRSLQLGSFEFRGLPNLLLSASSLVTLSLSNIHFVSPNRHELQSAFSQHPPPSTGFVFPALTRFEFKGYSRYLEDIVAQVNAPVLNDLSITLLRHNISTTPRFGPLISCPLNLKAPDNALMVFLYSSIFVEFRSQTSTSVCETLKLNIVLCSDLPLSSLALICGLSLPPLTTVERLFVIFASDYELDVQNARWLDLLYPFTALRKLYLSEELAPVSQGAIQVLPSTLQDIFLESQLQDAVPQPFTPQRLFSHHIVREQNALDHPPITELDLVSPFFHDVIYTVY